MRRMLAMLGGLALAVCFSQFPEYAQQYTQRLGGAVDVLRGEVARIDADAAANALSRAQYLERYTSAADPIFSNDGQNKLELIGRYETLQETLERITGASAMERFNLLPQFFDTEIGGRTLDNYKPAVPVTVEGFLYALFGFLLGYAVVSVIVSVVTLPWRWRRYRPAS